MRAVPPRLVEWAKRAYTGFYTRPAVARFLTDHFTRLYYQTPAGRRRWEQTTWLGVQVLKTPLDLWNYQEIIHEQRPDLLVETGTAAGGTALYFAHLFDLLGEGRVVSVDVNANEDHPAHPRITYLTGSSTAPDIVAEVTRRAEGCRRVLVVLDSDHRAPHVLRELRLYAGLVPVGGYLIVEDTSVNGHPVAPQFGPGPMEAVEAFLREDDRFVVDDRDRKFLLTFNPRGYLRRVR